MNWLKISLAAALILLSGAGCAHRSGSSPGDSRAQHYTTPEPPTDTGIISVSSPSDDVDNAFQNDNLDFLDEDDDTEPTIDVPDPLVTFNRAMFVFNDRAYFWVLKPVAQAYRTVTPEQARLCIKNFFYNIAAPVRFANCLLQGKFKTASKELGRFFINSTVGCGGLNDLSPLYPDLQTHPEDLGQTFGRYGIGEGFYIVWPLLGPSSLRDTVGKIGDIFIDPVTYFNTATLGMGARALDLINLTSFRIGDYETIKEAAIDPYEALRNGYLQFRRKQISQ